MPDDGRCHLHDPKYGKVKELCKSLGYASDGKKTPRSMHSLSLKTTRFRKKFVENLPELLRFPLEHDSAEAQACASRFLTSNSHLFEDSSEAQAFSWPTYPADELRLKDNLAKLMCTQEFLYRKNVCYAESKDKRDREEIEDSASDESDSEHSDVVDHLFSPTASPMHPTAKNVFTRKRLIQAQEERDARTCQQVLDNIEIHLNFVYPLDGSTDGKSYRWIFNDEKFPDEIKPFAWRYFHEHNLYSARKSNHDAVVTFARSLKRHLNITCNDAEDVVIQRRCERLISSSARIWNVFRGYGFLVERDGIPRKTAQFEAAWTERRSKWIDSVHNGNPTGVIELATSPSADIWNGAGTKRSHLHPDFATNLSSYDASTAPPVKRPKLTDLGGTPNVSQTASEEMLDFDTGRRRLGARSVEAEVIGGPRRAPEAPMITPVASMSQASAKSALSEPEQYENYSHQYSSSVNTDVNANRSSPFSPSPSPPFQSVGPSAHNTATLDDSLDMPTPLEKRSTTYALKGSSLDVPFDVHTALVKSTEMVTPSQPPKPNLLHYIVQNSRGALDYDTELPREKFLDSTISEFFNYVATRTGKSAGSLTQLTFIYNWGQREAFVVRRYGGDQYWGKIKERVKGTFLDARNSMKKRTEFELWIKCGDTTNLDDVDQDVVW